ncbi:MAG: hypothetical protein MJ134_02190 [Lachnospiraceae bacterium]|nr:hypothetical protein [Lachnospiraceae bacterium]
MVNEERIKLMTKMAVYEAGEGKKDKAITGYFRSDYISLQILKSIVSATVSFVILFALYIFYDFEIFMKDIYKMDMFQFTRLVLILYLVFTGVFVLITYVVYAIRYNKAKGKIKKFFGNLKRMSVFYYH